MKHFNNACTAQFMAVNDLERYTHINLFKQICPAAIAFRINLFDQLRLFFYLGNILCATIINYGLIEATAGYMGNHDHI